MDTECIQHRGQRHVIANRVNQFDRLILAEKGRDRVIGGIARPPLRHQLVHEAKNRLLVGLLEHRAFAASKRIDIGLVNAGFACKACVRRPFMAGAPMHRDNENRKFEQPPIQRRMESQTSPMADQCLPSAGR